THLFSPTLLGTFHYGYNWTFFGTTNVPGGVDLLNATNQAGLTPVRNAIPIVPQIGLSPRLGGTGQFAIPLGPIRSHQFSADIQKIHGSHTRSEEHTSELQSRRDLVCRLLLEKKKKNKKKQQIKKELT